MSRPVNVSKYRGKQAIATDLVVKQVHQSNNVLLALDISFCG